MNAVDLQRPDLLPDVLQERLAAIEPLCQGEEFSCELVKLPKVKAVVLDIDSYCLQRRVLGIHYTRAVRTDIEERGLIVRTGTEIREEFIHRFGSRFDATELQWLQAEWFRHVAKQSGIRDSQLWFNFTLGAFGGPGSEPLLGQYGGEKVHMGIEQDTSIGRKLANIGEPLIVRCALDPMKVMTFIEHPWGKILVSSFHLSVNPGAYRIDQDGSTTESVLPMDLTVEIACK